MLKICENCIRWGTPTSEKTAYCQQLNLQSFFYNSCILFVKKTGMSYPVTESKYQIKQNL